MFGIKSGKEEVKVKPSSILLPSKEEIKEAVEKSKDIEKDQPHIANYEIRELFIHVSNTVRDTIGDLRKTVTEKIDNIYTVMSGIADVLNEHKQLLLGLKSKLAEPPVMHPETALLRAETKERIAFLEKMVTNLTERVSNSPASVAVPEPKIIKEEVLVEVEKPFDVDKLTEDQLKKCAAELNSEDLFDLIDLEDLDNEQLEKAARLLPVDKLLRLAREKKSG